MKKETKQSTRTGCCEKICSWCKKKVSKLSNYADAVIILAVLGLIASVVLKLVYPGLRSSQINCLTVFRFSTFLILLGIALLLSRQKQKD